MRWRLVFSLWCTLWCTLSARAADAPQELPQELVVVSWNVLADASERERRLPALLALLRDAHPDVIAVQEATTWFSAALAGEPWAKDLRRVTVDADQPFPGGLALFTRLAVVRAQTVELTTNMGRCGIVVELAVPQGLMSFGVVHLDSYLEDGPTRSRQMGEMARALHGREHAVLLGDFNFGDGMAEGADQPKDFTDLWPSLHAGSPGFTWDIERSLMARRGSFPDEPSRRLDRVLLHSSRWQATAMTLLGTDPVPDTSGEVFPSDHFGMRVVLSATGNPQEKP